MNLYDLKNSGMGLTVNVPKIRTSKFQIKNSYYVATDGHSFNYYGVKIHPDGGGPLLRFEKSPPIFMEGLVVFEGKIYRVSTIDLSHRIIRKSKEISLGAIHGTNPDDITTSSVATDSNTATPIPNSNEFSIDPTIDVEVNKAANTAWEDEIRTLLDHILEKEGESDLEEYEWEDASNT